MRHFQKIGEFDPLQVTHALTLQPDLWNANDLRTTFAGTPHASVDDIWLRFNEPAALDLDTVGDELDIVDYPAWKELNQVRPIVFDLMRRVEGSRLGRVIITRLAPGRTIARHQDTLGKYADYYTRYHCVLQGLPGSLFKCGDEIVNMKSGEVWWFNAHEFHECVNNSADDRIHMLVDIRRG